MGGPYNPDCPVAKGPVPYCLETLSRAADARTILETLRDGISALAPTYHGLAGVFEKDLLTILYSDAEAAAIRLHLERHWFDAPPATAYFPSEAVAQIYAKGMLETLNRSLNGGSPLSITAAWRVGHPKVEMATSLMSGVLSLDILTPRPRGAAPIQAAPILGQSTVWVTGDVGGNVTTTRFDGNPNAPSARRK
jgi:hypothetical protein